MPFHGMLWNLAVPRALHDCLCFCSLHQGTPFPRSLHDCSCFCGLPQGIPFSPRHPTIALCFCSLHQGIYRRRIKVSQTLVITCPATISLSALPDFDALHGLP
ncbi:uncharacterized protein CIMG_11187 [Coccidioides immitis RS]|uniref:Uncharacterized protein n=3 Tax=Coccidioides immitis TaxID=5501 RepID=A0A0D8JX93_COCIM|nr:uncharacterized protein CIMG_11187 [Coccidioides immitis RS]KJF61556.1 hypothetical protein CIMG_11187 [Coccidioides immitis RS]KMP07965.1 hypothetical protein CIRG_07646 [Coccidioides immitis RMSCC 2394]KMU85158.1 hypothetical protein CIHG_02940 [Coccidioides immitis H538.4]